MGKSREGCLHRERPFEPKPGRGKTEGKGQQGDFPNSAVYRQARKLGSGCKEGKGVSQEELEEYLLWVDAPQSSRGLPGVLLCAPAGTALTPLCGPLMTPHHGNPGPHVDTFPPDSEAFGMFPKSFTRKLRDKQNPKATT